MSGPLGVLLINLGTPDAPTSAAVRRYLREFLGDPRVIDLPALPRTLLLEAAILPTRPRASAAAYAKVWTDAGSPLLVHGQALASALQDELGEAAVVRLGMRYGQPSLARALRSLEEHGVRRVVALPLFPQYSSAATGSALDALFAEPAAGRLTQLEVVPPFFADPGFIDAWAAVSRPALDGFGPDFVLLSYHGLPERQIRAGDVSGAHCLELDDCCEPLRGAGQHCYRAQCFATSRAIVAALGLETERTRTSFQSRLGRTPWIQPYTDFVLPELAEQGVRRLAVLCPAFVADCLETVEEIGMRAQEQWAEVGGEELLLVPSLNAHPRWVEAVAALVRQSMATDASTRSAAATPDASASATPTPAT
ncbi:MAG: ferrochelatase [Myxococcota bacterium]